MVAWGPFVHPKQGAISSMLFYGYPMVSPMDTSMWYPKVTLNTVATFFDRFAASFVDTERFTWWSCRRSPVEDLVVLRNDGTTKSAIAPSRHSVAAAYRGRPLDSFWVPALGSLQQNRAKKVHNCFKITLYNEQFFHILSLFPWVLPCLLYSCLKIPRKTSAPIYHLLHVIQTRGRGILIL